MNGIASIAEKWLIICTFQLLVLLYLVCPHSVLLALGQRMRSHMFPLFHITISYVVLDGLPSYCLSA